jgi:signal transduction protein with GAF and PtsI domain
MTTMHKNQADAVRAVREKYDEIMHLFDRYNRTKSKNERETIISEVSACLSYLNNVETKEVYPVIRQESHTEGLAICEETHSQVRLVLDKLMRLCADLDTRDYDQSVEKLRTSIRDLNKKEECLFQANEL